MAVALAIAAAAVSLSTPGCGGSQAPAARPHAADVSRPPSEDARSGSRLRLVRHGQPIVWLRHGVRIPIRSAPAGKVVTTLDSHTQFGSPTVLAVFRREGEWVGVPTPLLPNGVLGWVKLDPSKLKAGWTRYSIDVDLSARMAQLRLRGRMLRSFTVSVGAPSSPTPTGRFAVTDTFRGDLNPAYGCCALATTALQPHVPSGWLGGNRIAIHATSGPLGEAISHGCVRAPEADVDAIVTRVPLGTPVVIHD
jgi:hypothetical protein